MRPTLLTILVCWMFAVSTYGKQTGCPLMKIQVERLPDLNIPRASHQLFCVNGEYVVAGGHTNGFLPTPTAEYYKDGEWHTLQMVYNHDYGFSVVLKSGKVLLAGGCEQPIGIGQTFLAEMYDPSDHSFDGFNCMDQKRAGASGLELDSGQVVIAGNWYHNDGIELFDGNRHFTYIKDVSAQRAMPYILRTSKDDALIFGDMSTKGDTLLSTVADRLMGDTVHIPLFEKWHPIFHIMSQSSESAFGDESKGVYAYLIPVYADTRQIAIAQVVNGDFSLLPTACPVPMESRWGSIDYFSSVIVDRQRGRAYLVGCDSDFRKHPDKGVRFYVLRIDYAVAKDKPAALTLYYTDPLKDLPDYTPVLTPDGDLLFAGGLTMAMSNFAPSRAAFLFRFSPLPDGQAGCMWWLWVILPVVLLLAVSVYLFIRHRRRHVCVPTGDPIIKEQDIDRQLMERIRHLMEERKLYLNSELKVSDIANELGVHRNDIASCIKNQTGGTFIQLINYYRIEYAKRLLRHTPETKISSVWMASGFATEQSFFRIFRNATGMTPKEWTSATID